MLIPLEPWFYLNAGWQFLAPVHNASRSMPRVVEFHVPANFCAPRRMTRWIPPDARGKLIEFPARKVRKLA